MKKDTTRGNTYIYDEDNLLDTWWEDTGEKFSFSDGEDNLRPCTHCGQLPTDKGHDACIANLPFVTNACCGHGNIKNCYIQFDDGTTVYGERAKKIQEKLK